MLSQICPPGVSTDGASSCTRSEGCRAGKARSYRLRDAWGPPGGARLTLVAHYVCPALYLLSALRPHTSARASRHPAMREETERDAEKRLDTPPAPHARRPIGLAAAPVERVVAASAPSARGWRLAGGRAAPHPVGHRPGSAADGLTVACGPNLVHAAGALLGTPGAVLACAGAHGRGGRGGHRARDGGGARGASDPRASGLRYAGCLWRAESERARGLSRASQGH